MSSQKFPRSHGFFSFGLDSDEAQEAISGADVKHVLAALIEHTRFPLSGDNLCFEYLEMFSI
jgi:DNA-directed RNA polymerase specialized sigma54-like protein